MMRGLGILTLLCLSVTAVTAQETATACYGSDPACCQYQLQCPPGQTIQLNSAVYGTKPERPECVFGVSDCGATAGCCDYDAADLFTPFSDADFSTLHQNCAGNSECTVNAPRLAVNPFSSYVVVTYTCSDGTVQYIPGTQIPYIGATQSSEHPTHKRPATLALDGDNNTISHTTIEDNPWWKLDFGTTVNVEAVEFVNRNDCCFDQMSDFEISVDGVLCGFYQGPLGQGASTKVVCGQVLPGNTLQIQRLRTNDVLNIAEVKVYAACLPPEDAQFASVGPVNQFYYPGDIVTYKCDECYELVGEATRTCSDVGTWEGPLPVCSVVGQMLPHSNVMYTNVSQSSEHPTHKRPAALAVDNDPTTISHTTIQDNPWWKIEFCEVVNVAAVQILNRHDCCYDQLTLLEITVDGALCNHYDVPAVSSANVTVQCVEVLSGKTLQIMRLKANDVLNLAEVRVIEG